MRNVIQNGLIIVSSAQPQRRVSFRKKRLVGLCLLKNNSTMLQSLSLQCISPSAAVNFSEFQFILWGEIMLMVAHWYGYHHKMSHSELVRRTPFDWMKFNEFHWTSGAQMRSNERCVHSPSAGASVLVYILHDRFVRATYTSYTITTTTTTTVIQQLHHASHELTHTQVRTHAAYMQTLLRFFHEWKFNSVRTVWMVFVRFGPSPCVLHLSSIFCYS